MSILADLSNGLILIIAKMLADRIKYIVGNFEKPQPSILIKQAKHMKSSFYLA